MTQNIFQNVDSLLRFDPRLLIDGRLEVIVKYSGDITFLASVVESIEILNGIFAIITGTAEQIKALYFSPLIEYIELPKTLTYELSSSRFAVCATRAQDEPYNLTGAGTAIGIIDSGIDHTHPDFINDDGTSRIYSIWDQTGVGIPPMGFSRGVEYTNEQINQSLFSQNSLDFRDIEGHGTAVAGIACGNGKQSSGREKGIAPKATIIAVKLGRRGYGAFPRTTEIMRGVKYTLDKAKELNMPLSINISYGTNNGSHDGNSLFEQYIDSAADQWKTAISVATGNEGAAGHHFSYRLETNRSVNIPIFVTGAPNRIYMTLWKNFSDNMTFRLTSPQNLSSGEISPNTQTALFSLSDTDITVFYGQPSPLSQYQEVYFLFETNSGFIQEGLWTLTVNGLEIIDGQFDIWLPTVEDVTNDTAFAEPSTDVTLTLPSTAKNVISVGGYNANTNSLAPFSGRGFTRNDVYVKPDITAPSVDIFTTRSGGGYMLFSGTSFASPFVAGAACLLMEWGIVKGNDSFLYGQRLKAFLQKGARRTKNLIYPNNQWGYGTLCISSTLDLLTQYNSGGVFL